MQRFFFKSKYNFKGNAVNEVRLAEKNASLQFMSAVPEIYERKMRSDRF